MREFRVPKLSLGEGDQMVVLDWLVAGGEAFAEGDILLEVETDKATMEVDAPFAGVLAKALCGEGDAVVPGQLIAWIADPGEEYDSGALSGEDAAAPAEPPATASASGADGDGARPEVGTVELAPVRGRAPVLVDHGELRGIPAASTPGMPLAAPPISELDPEGAGDFEELPFSRHRSAIARSMTASAAVPQFAVERLLAVEPALATLRVLREQVAEATLTDVLLIGIADALAEVPVVNAWCDGARTLRFAEANIAVAVDGPDGVIAPVIRDTGRRAPAEVVAERIRVVELARAGRVSGGDLAGATFSLSNIGPLKAHALLPMLTPPQVGILAVGAGRPDGEGSVMMATMVGDHRAIDGADGARFLAGLAEAIEGMAARLTP